MNRSLPPSEAGKSICPTRVGMTTHRVRCKRDRANLPHARGDDHIKEKHDFTQRIWKQMRDLYQWVKGRALKQRD